jgi:hypothetical protein
MCRFPIDDDCNLMRPILRILAILILFYSTWMGMMAVHEFGHILHAWISGASVSHVSLPLVGFSQTFFRFNPHAYFVVWGGPLWGSLMPVAIWFLFPKRWSNPRRVIQFFAGFCLIANGAYLGVGWTMRVGDAGDLIEHGTPVWVLVAFGAIAMTAGLYLWHLLGVPDSQVTVNVDAP